MSCDANRSPCCNANGSVGCNVNCNTSCKVGCNVKGEVSCKVSCNRSCNRSRHTDSGINGAAPVALWVAMGAAAEILVWSLQRELQPELRWSFVMRGGEGGGAMGDGAAIAM